LLAKDRGEDVIGRQEGRPDHLVELVLADLVDEETERGEVAPLGHVHLERVDLALGSGPEEDVGAVEPDHPEHSEELAAMVDLFGPRVSEAYLNWATSTAGYAWVTSFRKKSYAAFSASWLSSLKYFPSTATAPGLSAFIFARAMTSEST